MSSPTTLPGGKALSAYNPDFRRCPHAFVDQARAAGPCHWDPEFDRYVLTGFEAARAMLLRPEVSAAPSRLRQRPADAPPGLFERTILQLDVPDHRPVRAVISRAFNAARVAVTRASVEAAAHELLEALYGSGFDLRAGFATPLATRTMADLLGLDRALHPSISGWVDDLTAAFDPFATAEALGRMHAAEAALRGIFLRRCAATEVSDGGADVIGQLLRAGVTPDAVAANATFLLGAGITSTADLITSGLRLLLTHPDQLRRLRADPALMSGAIEEALRLEPPVAQFARIAGPATTLDGLHVPEGVGLSVSVIAAGCDPALHEDPMRFDIGRAQHAHLAFAAGIHACPGSLLARMEASVAWAAVLGRFPALRLAEPLAERRVSLVFNGWESLCAHPS